MNGRTDQTEAPLDIAGAGLPDAPAVVDEKLRDAGIDPDRLAISYFGRPGAGRRAVRPVGRPGC
jgi:hypothetical protein